MRCGFGVVVRGVEADEPFESSFVRWKSQSRSPAWSRARGAERRRRTHSLLRRNSSRERDARPDARATRGGGGGGGRGGGETHLRIHGDRQFDGPEMTSPALYSLASVVTVLAAPLSALPAFGSRRGAGPPRAPRPRERPRRALRPAARRESARRRSPSPAKPRNGVDRLHRRARLTMRRVARFVDLLATRLERHRIHGGARILLNCGRKRSRRWKCLCRSSMARSVVSWRRARVATSPTSPPLSPQRGRVHLPGRGLGIHLLGTLGTPVRARALLGVVLGGGGGHFRRRRPAPRACPSCPAACAPCAPPPRTWCGGARALVKVSSEDTSSSFGAPAVDRASPAAGTGRRARRACRCRCCARSTNLAPVGAPPTLLMSKSSRRRLPLELRSRSRRGRCPTGRRADRPPGGPGGARGGGSDAPRPPSPARAGPAAHAAPSRAAEAPRSARTEPVDKSLSLPVSSRPSARTRRVRRLLLARRAARREAARASAAPSSRLSRSFAFFAFVSAARLRSRPRRTGGAPQHRRRGFLAELGVAAPSKLPRSSRRKVGTKGSGARDRFSVSLGS